MRQKNHCSTHLPQWASLISYAETPRDSTGLPAGCGALAQILGNERTRRIPVIAISGCGAEGAEVLEAGFVKYLRKPWPMKRLTDLHALHMPPASPVA